jgi:NAD(P)-dependent dehydrogenase (short-subunit alcohol dehydrogenase family)
MGEGKLAGKRALVTGAGTGIGREVALEFARQGADVVLHYSHAPAGAESAAQQIQALGRRATIFKADFNDAGAVNALAESTLDFLGGIDCLVNNAGITFNCPFHKITAGDLDVLFNVNFRSPFLLTQKLTEPMVKQGSGAICNLSSIHGLQGAPEHSAYAATKGAIVAYTRAYQCHRSGMDLCRRPCRRDSGFYSRAGRRGCKRTGTGGPPRSSSRRGKTGRVSLFG